MYQYSGKTALVTGASSGLGEAFARALARRGMNLVLVARTESKLQALAAELRRDYNICAEPVPVDLSKPGAGQALHAATTGLGLRIDLLVNNAGFSTLGEFETIDPAWEQECVMVNVAALLDITHAYVPDMLAQGGGAIINLASVLSFVPGGRQATYAATKAFVFSFTQALWSEYRKRGIRVFALCPGPVDTGFFGVINSEPKFGLVPVDKPAAVVESGLKAFEKRKLYKATGWLSSVTALTAGLFPRKLTSSLMYFMTTKVYKPVDAKK